MKGQILLVALICCIAPCAARAATRPIASQPVSPAKALAEILKRPSLSGALDKAFKKYQRLTGLRVEVDWPALEATGVKKTDKVSLRASKITAEQLLELLLAKAEKKGKPLSWYLNGKIIRVTTQRRVLSRRRLPVFRRTRTNINLPKKGRPTPRTIEFDQTELSDVIVFFRETTGLNIYVQWSSLEELGISRETPVTLKVSGLRLAKVLTMVVDQLSTSRDKLSRVYWVVDGGVVKIASGASLNTQLRTRIFDVADLLMAVPNFSAPAVGTGGSNSTTGNTGSGSSGRDGDDSSAQREKTAETLVEIVKQSIGEEMWHPIGKGSVRIHNNRLIVSQTLLGFKLMEQSAGK